MDNLRWIKDSIDGYKNFFDGFELDMTTYISSDLIILMKVIKMLQSFKKFIVITQIN